MSKRNLDMRYFALTALAGSILCLNQTSYALQAMQDHDLRMVDGQDGISINTEYTTIDIDELYWEDQAGTAGNSEITLKASAKGVKIDKNAAYDYGGKDLGTSYTINAGANGDGQVGIDLQIVSQPSTISVDNFQICEGTTCDDAIGRLAIQTGSPLHIGLKTTDGLFNKHAQAELDLGIKNVNIFTGLQVVGSTTNYNQLILKNTNFNFFGKGVAYVNDIEGFVLNTNTGATGIADKSQTPNAQYGYVDFTRVDIPLSEQIGTPSSNTSTYGLTSSGLNLEFMLKSDQPMANADLSSAGADGLIRVGASGRMVNSFLQIRGTDASELAAVNSVLGYASNASGTSNTPPNNTLGDHKSVMGSTGIALRLRGEFTRDGDGMLQQGTGDRTGESIKLEIGGAGNNTFGFEFSELSPLISNSPDRAYFDSGNVYINLAKTQHLQMPVNTVLNNSRFGGKVGDCSTGTAVGTCLTNNADYVQQIHEKADNPRSVVIAIRGADFQAVSKRGRFTSSQGILNTDNIIAPNEGLTNQWGLGLPFYNVNSNIALYTTTHTGSYYTLSSGSVTPVAITGSDRLGFALALSVQGQDASNTKTTAIVVVDATQDLYIGLRNIDMLLRGYGTIGLEGGQMNIDLPNLLMVMSAEIAGGFFPEYKNLGDLSQGVDNPFNSKTDVLFGLKLKLLGDMNFSLIPNNEISTTDNAARLAIVGRYNLTKGGGSTIQLSDPIDESMIGLDNIEGLIQFDNSISIKKDTVGFNYSFEFNPAAGQTATQREANVFRVRDINLYPPLNAPTGVDPLTYNNRGQRLGEMVFTGGRISTEMAIRPRNN